MCSSSITSFHFAWELQTVENCPTVAWGEECWHTALLMIKKEEEKKETFLCLLSFITFLRQVNNQVDPWEKLRCTPCKATVETLPCCECTNITRPHTRSQCAICFLQCHHRLLHRDCLILSFLYSSEWFSFSFFLYWDKLDTFIFVCIWLPT